MSRPAARRHPAALAGSADLFADHAAQRLFQRLSGARYELAEGIVNQALIVTASGLST